MQLIAFLALAPSSYLKAHGTALYGVRGAVACLPSVMQAYIGMVYVYSFLVHANIGGHFGRPGRFIVKPRFHHWHHALEAEGINKNFAIHRRGRGRCRT